MEGGIENINFNELVGEIGAGLGGKRELLEWRVSREVEFSRISLPHSYLKLSPGLAGGRGSWSEEVGVELLVGRGRLLLKTHHKPRVFRDNSSNSFRACGEREAGSLWQGAREAVFQVTALAIKPFDCT